MSNSVRGADDVPCGGSPHRGLHRTKPSGPFQAIIEPASSPSCHAGFAAPIDKTPISYHNAFDTLSIPFTGEFAVNYGSGTNSQVILRTVPEPGALVLLLLGLATILPRRNRI